VFANEPLLRVEAPLWQAQLVETYLLNTLNYQSLIATRAARLRDVGVSEQHCWNLGQDVPLALKHLCGRRVQRWLLVWMRHQTC
jgi:hypothetical protein